MPEDLTPRIVQQYDSAELQPGGSVRNTTIVRFMVGRFGPFEKVFDRGPQKFDIEQVMREQRDRLEGLV
jgi:hypothetical protein